MAAELCNQQNCRACLVPKAICNNLNKTWFSIQMGDGGTKLVCSTTFVIYPKYFLYGRIKTVILFCFLPRTISSALSSGVCAVNWDDQSETGPSSAYSNVIIILMLMIIQEEKVWLLLSTTFPFNISTFSEILNWRVHPDVWCDRYAYQFITGTTGPFKVFALSEEYNNFLCFRISCAHFTSDLANLTRKLVKYGGVLPCWTTSVDDLWVAD